MSESKIAFRLWEPVQAFQRIKTVWEWCKSGLLAGNRIELEARYETRSSKQNRLMHALFSDVADQAQWMGKPRTPAEWKVLFVSGHAVATNIGADLVPGLEGEFCNLRESTAKMSISRMNSLIEYVMAWSATNGVQIRKAQEWIDHETGEVYQ